MKTKTIAESISFNLQREVWFKLIRRFSFLRKTDSLGVRNFLKFLLGRTDKKYIKLELCSVCNVRCNWCWMYYDSVQKQTGMMEYDNFKKFMALNTNYLLKNKIRIIPYFNGESLLHPQVFQVLEDISNSGIKMSGLHTNLSLNIDIEKLMSFPLVEFTVNMGGLTKEVHEKVMRGSNFDLVVSNLKRMIAINKDITFIKINPTKDNVYQLKSIRKFMKDLGGHPDNTVVSTTGFTLPFLATEQEKEEFLSKVVGNEEDIEKFLCFHYSKNKKGEVIIKPKKLIKKCTMLIDSVRFDGRVTICAHDPLGKVNLGNAFETSLGAIRKSSQYKDIYSKAKRRNLDFCKDCN